MKICVTNNGLCYMVSTQLEFHTASSSFVGSFSIIHFCAKLCNFFSVSFACFCFCCRCRCCSNNISEQISCSIISTCAHSCSCVLALSCTQKKQHENPRASEKSGTVTKTFLLEHILLAGSFVFIQKISLIKCAPH